MSGLAEILDENARLRREMAGMKATYEKQLRDKDQEIAKRDAMVEALKTSAEDLARRLEFLNLAASGPASQRYVPDEQEVLPFVGDIVLPPRAPKSEDNEGDETSAKSERKPKGIAKTPRRRTRQDVAHMPSREVRCPTDNTPCARCGRPLTVIGQANSFRVEWVPGHFIVEDVVRDKCACANCPDQGVLTVPGPYALDRALCGNGLLARILVDKFADHLPTNRQAKRMRREGFEVGSNTLASWTKAGGNLLGVVARAVLTDLLAQPFLQGDDTGMPVQDGGNGALRRGRMWAFTDQQQVVYAFTDTKEGKFPAHLLEGFAGELLLVDGGSEFNQVVREQGLKRAGCWSHLRTYFFDARHHHPSEVHAALGTIRDLFMLERSLWGETPDVVRARREPARPLVDGFFAWVKALSPQVRPKSKLGEAIRYAINQEDALRLHLEHGELPMHNNLSELMLRQTVVGRKNWLFARSEGGAHVAAICYTLIGSCMLQGVDPHAYLVDVLGRLLDHPSNRVDELTPRNWRLAREGHPIASG